MITPCTEKDTGKILEYIGKDYGHCLYIYIDLIKYGLANENFFAWIQTDDDGKITAILTEYFKGIQVYSKDCDLDAKEVADFVLEKDPPVFLGSKEVIDQVWEYMPEHKQEVGTVGQLRELKVDADATAYAAALEELPEICELVAADEDIGAPYGYDSLLTQYTERMEDDFGRNFISRDPEDNEIICHAGTYAELPELAVIGGVITAPKFRGKGRSKPTLAAICKQLLAEDKDVFSFYYIPAATSMHTGVGFEKVCDWAKLYK